eukprot:1636214-Rhodomonas_salina.6
MRRDGESRGEQKQRSGRQKKGVSACWERYKEPGKEEEEGEGDRREEEAEVLVFGRNLGTPNLQARTSSGLGVATGGKEGGGGMAARKHECESDRRVGARAGGPGRKRLGVVASQSARASPPAAARPPSASCFALKSISSTSNA